MKKLLLVASVLLLNYAQGISQELSADYDRVSLTILSGYGNIQGDKSKAELFRYKSVSNIDREKFDINNINTKSINIGSYNLDSYSSSKIKTIRKPKVDNSLDENNIGKEIVSYLLSRNEDGIMSGSRLESRGLRNATLNDENDAQALAIGQSSALKDKGYALLNKNYVLVVESVTSVASTSVLGSFVDLGRATVGASSCLIGYLYKLDLNENMVNDVLFNKAWIYSDDSEEVRQEKNKLFDSIKYNFKFVGVFKYQFSDQGTDCNQLISKIENKVADWEVRSPVVKTSPIEARIGKKEALRNGDKYNSYQYVMGRDNKIKMQKTAVLRASKVVDNREDNSLTSQFVRVAGYQVKEGYVLKQKNDIGLNLDLGYRMGAMPAYLISLDWLTRVRTNNISSYIILNAGYNTFDLAKRYENNNNGMSLPSDRYYDDRISLITTNLGIGAGYRFLVNFELEARAMVGLGFLQSPNSEYSQDVLDDESGRYDDDSTSEFLYQFGAKFKVNIAYPLKVFVGADYIIQSKSDPNSDTEIYAKRRDIMEQAGVKFNGLAFSAGLSYTF